MENLKLIFCLLIIQFVSLSTQSTTEPPPPICQITCESREHCNVYVNYDVCECVYQCTTTPEPTTCDPGECSGPDRFCTYMRNPETCECEVQYCCTVISCPNGYEVCDSCSNCRCNPDNTTPPEITTTEPPPQCTLWCPDKDGCRTIYNYDECRCDYECTDTTPGPTTCEPVECQGSDRFCEYRINSETCECEPFVCCSPPYCPNGFEVCDSCSNCRCNPDITTPPYTTTEPPPQCTLWCPDKDGCKTIYNYNECRCDYDCTATTPSSKVFKCVQI
ncbi:CLUMA_CG002437, isoform A [Clunio marinus]|uniref:CLUMA_CG002437, isoform A n=1 Tax=Clunio marinus TaxID=568069 RepID=A0A1J1HKV3_9DIPT|nr:CLUMA_CG002437, isoform A [Clunio marinus]